MDLDHQRTVEWWSEQLDSHPTFEEWARVTDPPDLTNLKAQLEAWDRLAREDEERSRERPKDPSANWSGTWWSTPSPVLRPTTRSVAGLPALGISCVEDTMGWKHARTWPIDIDPSARIYEVSQPTDWTDLVARYPRVVTLSRRHDWFRVTGWRGGWSIPDWPKVAQDYDGVHVSVTGYLTTAGKLLHVGDVGTLLAGWDPDATFWLGDVVSIGGPAEHWSGDHNDPTDWVQI
jgi:hypothetical protein